MDDIRQEIRQMSTDLKTRIDGIHDGIADKIKEIMGDLITTVKEEMSTRFTALENRITALESKSRINDRDNNIVIYGLAEEAEGVEENVVQRVNSLLVNELRLVDVQVVDGDRKPKHDRDCGVIVAKCGNTEHKQKIMEAKSKLRQSEHFSHIHITHDKPRWQRQHESNVRMVVKTLGTDKLYLKGSRVCLKDAQRNDWRDGNGRGQVQGQVQGQVRGRGRGRGRTQAQRNGRGRHQGQGNRM